MFLRNFIVMAILSLSAVSSHAAGLKPIEVPADVAGPVLKALVWSPCADKPTDIELGPMVLKATRGCAVAGQNLPLIVVSHGYGGSALGHHDTAEALASAGFLVVALNHPGDNYANMGQAGDISVMFERPTDIKRLIDYMLGNWPDAARIDPHRVGFFGFSRGGYTGLVLAGAKPDFRDPTVPCPEPAPICGQIKRNEIPVRPLTQDQRIKAFVLADPLSFFSARDSLKSVNVPIQLWGSEHGGDGVLPQSIVSLSENLPNKPEFHSVRGAGHFAFLAPCPAGLAKQQPEICTDTSGFSRSEFHQTFDTAVVAFFKAQLDVN